MASTGFLPLVVGLFTFYFGVFGGHKFEQISPQMYRGSAPSKENLQELKAMGVKTVVNVRTNSMPKRAKWCKEAGMKYFHIKTGVFHIPKEKEIEEFLTIIQNPENQPVYICCTLGTDRTACYSAMYRVAAQGWTAEQAYTEQVEKGLKEWWPIFRKYSKTLQIVQSHREQLAGGRAPEMTASGQIINGAATGQAGGPTTESRATSKETMGTPPASRFLGTTRESVLQSEHGQPKKSGALPGTL